MTDRLSILDLNFFGILACPVLERNKDAIHAFVRVTLGGSWLEDLTVRSRAFQAALDDLLRELAETTDARREVDRICTRVGHWRRTTESTARQASPDKQKQLLRAAGYGKGSPRLPKEWEEFLQQVTPTFLANAKHWKTLEVPAPVMEFPARTLEQLRVAVALVATERAEDAEARRNLAVLRRQLEEMFNAVDVALQRAKSQGLLLEDPESVERATVLEDALAAALAEARTQSRKRAAEQPLPPELTDAAKEEEEEEEDQPAE